MSQRGSREVGAEAADVKWKEAEERLAAAFLESQGAADGTPVYPFRTQL